MNNIRQNTRAAFPRRTRHSFWLAGVAVAASAVLALWLGPPTGPVGDDTSQPFVTQALTVPDPGQWTETSARQPLSDWFRRNGIDGFEIPDIDDAQLWRGRMTRIGGQLSAAVDFRLEGSVPFTYIMVPGAAIFSGITESAILTMESDEWNVAMWAENGTARAVLSTMNAADLVIVAQACKDKAAL